MITKVLADRGIVISDIKFDDLSLLAKQSPDDLILKDENENEIFRIDVGTTYSCFEKYGATFVKDGEKAITVFDVPLTCEDKKAYVVDNYGKSIENLKTMELKLAERVEEVKRLVEEIKNGIELIDDINDIE